jgi:hypothetical protein
MFEKRVLGRVFGPKRNEEARGWRKCIVKSLITCTLHQILLGLSNQGG